MLRVRLTQDQARGTSKSAVILALTELAKWTNSLVYGLLQEKVRGEFKALLKAVEEIFRRPYSGLEKTTKKCSAWRSWQGCQQWWRMDLGKQLNKEAGLAQNQDAVHTLLPSNINDNTRIWTIPKFAYFHVIIKAGKLELLMDTGNISNNIFLDQSKFERLFPTNPTKHFPCIIEIATCGSGHVDVVGRTKLDVYDGFWNWRSRSHHKKSTVLDKRINNALCLPVISPSPNL